MVSLVCLSCDSEHEWEIPLAIFKVSLCCPECKKLATSIKIGNPMTTEQLQTLMREQ